ncbi:MAG: PAS domain-containing protein, partial [Acidobacteria bacterium]|nr:PAS domain-containing protein [Acidobacteriota bacterium]
MFTADALLNAISQAVLATDSGGTIVFSNPAADHLFGGTASPVVGRSLAAVMPDHEVSELFAVVREEGIWSGGRRSPDDDSLSFITACA